MKSFFKTLGITVVGLYMLLLLLHMFTYYMGSLGGGKQDYSHNVYVQTINAIGAFMEYRNTRGLVNNLKMQCVTEEQSHPPLDPQADEWFKRALAIQKGEIPGTGAEVVKLYEQAIERKHWKAYSNLAYMYLYGEGVEEDTSKGIDILEAGMELNIARCYAMMADCLASGNGVDEDQKDSWIYARRAAELGDRSAQATVGDKLFMMGYDEGISIMECAAKQDDPDAARQLGAYYAIGTSATPFDQQKALMYYQQATRLGSLNAALYLGLAFEEMEMGLEKDPKRAEHYRKIADFIEAQSDSVTITNLDDIVPLPPAPLPKWDGKIEIAK